MYDSTIGRWISEDPIDFQGGDLHLSRYVNNAPNRFRDPSGLILEVDGRPVAAGDSVYTSLNVNSISKEVLDTMIASRHRYTYSRDDLATEIAVRQSVVNAANRFAKMVSDKKINFDSAVFIHWGVNYKPQEKHEAYRIVRESMTRVKEFDCFFAVEYTMTLAMYDWLGEMKFNAFYTYMKSEYPQYKLLPFPKPDIDSQYAPGSDPGQSPRPDREDLLPGDIVGFSNPGAVQPWQSENAIYLGGGDYLAHPFGIVTKEKILSKLAGAKKVEGFVGDLKPVQLEWKRFLAIRSISKHCK